MYTEQLVHIISLFTWTWWGKVEMERVDKHLHLKEYIQRLQFMNQAWMKLDA